MPHIGNNFFYSLDLLPLTTKDFQNFKYEKVIKKKNVRALQISASVTTQLAFGLLAFIRYKKKKKKKKTKRSRQKPKFYKNNKQLKIKTMN